MLFSSIPFFFRSSVDLFVCSFLPAPSDDSGCGILTDMLVHDVDVMVWLFKAERPESIYVVTHTHDPKMVEIGEPDTIVVLVKYKSGTIVTLDSTRYAAYGYDMRVEVSVRLHYTK